MSLSPLIARQLAARWVYSARVRLGARRFFDPLGELRACYGWKECLKLARARNVDDLFLDLALHGGGHCPMPVGNGVLYVDSTKLCRGLDRLQRADELRAGAKKKRIGDVSKARANPQSKTQAAARSQIPSTRRPYSPLH
jgi:hypothetical protein